MILPYGAYTALPYTITKCEANEFGSTDIEGTFCGGPLKPFRLENVQVGEKPGQAGFDDVRTRIEGEIASQVQAALQAVG